MKVHYTFFYNNFLLRLNFYNVFIPVSSFFSIILHLYYLLYVQYLLLLMAVLIVLRNVIIMLEMYLWLPKVLVHIFDVLALFYILINAFLYYIIYHLFLLFTNYCQKWTKNIRLHNGHVTIMKNFIFQNKKTTIISTIPSNKGKIP